MGGKLYTEQLKASQGYDKLSKAIGIHILNFTSIQETRNYHNVFHIKEKNSNLIYFKDLELHTIELNKFTSDTSEELSDLVAKIKTSLDIWSAFLTRNDLLKIDNLPKELNDNNLKKALEVLNVMNFSSEERELYDDHLKWLMIEANTLKKTREEGREEGIVIGEARGKAEIAKNLLKLGLSLDSVAEATGLTIEQIEKLKSS